MFCRRLGLWVCWWKTVEECTLARPWTINGKVPDPIKYRERSYYDAIVGSNTIRRLLFYLIVLVQGLSGTFYWTTCLLETSPFTPWIWHAALLTGWWNNLGNTSQRISNAIVRAVCVNVANCRVQFIQRSVEDPPSETKLSGVSPGKTVRGRISERHLR